jgi:hypothetical protein
MNKRRSGYHWLFSALAAVLLLLEIGSAEHHDPMGSPDVAFEDLPLMYD